MPNRGSAGRRVDSFQLPCRLVVPNPPNLAIADVPATTARGWFKRIILETQMDISERSARNYFVHLGFTRIDYEPEGCSKPPDLLLNARIVVEVRRLNQIETPSQAAGPAARVIFYAGTLSTPATRYGPAVTAWLRAAAGRWRAARYS
jgi:hypothetical protein